MRCSARTGNNHLKTFFFCRLSIFHHPEWCSVSRHDREFIFDVQLFENLGSFLHDGKVGFTPHNNAYLFTHGWAFIFIRSLIRLALDFNLERSSSRMVTWPIFLNGLVVFFPYRWTYTPFFSMAS